MSGLKPSRMPLAGIRDFILVAGKRSAIEEHLEITSVNRYNVQKRREMVQMLIGEQLEKLNMTKYRLSKDSGVPQATINDICSGKAELEKCAAGTLFKIAKVLGVSIEDILLSAGSE